MCMCECVYMYVFPKWRWDVANSRFIRAMQAGELFQIGESVALAFDLSSACSLILTLFISPLHTVYTAPVFIFNFLPSASTCSYPVLSFVSLTVFAVCVRTV